MNKIFWKTSLVFLLLTVSFSTSVFAQNQENENLKNEAFEFSLSIIQTYFTEDCESFYQKFAPQLYSIIDEEIMNVNEELKDEMCDSLEDAVDDKEKKYEDYLKDYNPRIFSKKEFEEKYKKIEPVGFEILDSDFFFMGNETELSFNEAYLWEELEVLLIRKQDGVWKIVGGQ